MYHSGAIQTTQTRRAARCARPGAARHTLRTPRAPPCGEPCAARPRRPRPPRQPSQAGRAPWPWPCARPAPRPWRPCRRGPPPWRPSSSPSSPPAAGSAGCSPARWAPSRAAPTPGGTAAAGCEQGKPAVQAMARPHGCRSPQAGRTAAGQAAARPRGAPGPGPRCCALRAWRRWPPRAGCRPAPPRPPPPVPPGAGTAAASRLLRADARSVPAEPPRLRTCSSCSSSLRLRDTRKPFGPRAMCRRSVVCGRRSCGGTGTSVATGGTGTSMATSACEPAGSAEACSRSSTQVAALCLADHLSQLCSDSGRGQVLRVPILLCRLPRPRLESSHGRSTAAAHGARA